MAIRNLTCAMQGLVAVVCVILFAGCVADAPDSTAMSDNAMASYQSEAPGPVEHTFAGTLEEVCDAMLRTCIGNPDGKSSAGPYDYNNVESWVHKDLVTACASALSRIANAGLLSGLQWVRGRTMFKYPDVTSILFTGKQRGKSFCVASTLGIFEALYWVGSHMRNRKAPEVFESLYMCTPCSPEALPSNSKVQIAIGSAKQHAQSLRPSRAYASVFYIAVKDNGVGVEVAPASDPYGADSMRDFHIPLEIDSIPIELRIDLLDLDKLLIAAVAGSVIYGIYTALLMAGRGDLALLFYYILNPELQPEFDGEIMAQQIEDAINASLRPVAASSSELPALDAVSIAQHP